MGVPEIDVNVFLRSPNRESALSRVPFSHVSRPFFISSNSFIVAMMPPQVQSKSGSVKNKFS
jgi:hypothetical protein